MSGRIYRHVVEQVPPNEGFAPVLLKGEQITPRRTGQSESLRIKYRKGTAHHA
ncbi:MAG: hypothetical protein ACKOZX_08640 [Gammaproteobacteria bacterium]